jgi:hypothetical protein
MPKTIIKVCVSDPWEFYEDNENCGFFYADLIDCQDNHILFYSHKPIVLRSKTGSKFWQSFFGTSRHAENIADKITTQDGCFCNVIAVADDIVSLSDAKLQMRAWRGGGTFIGSISIAVQPISSAPQSTMPESNSGRKTQETIDRH